MMLSGKKNIVLIGMPGSGKTTIGMLLAKKLDACFIDMDQYIENTWGQTIPQLFLRGEAYFRKLESEAVASLKDTKPAVISTGGGTVKDPSNMDILKENGVIVFIDRPLEDIAKDINLTDRPLLKGGAERLREIYHERYGLYSRYCDIRIVNDRSDADAVKSIIEALAANGITNGNDRE